MATSYLLVVGILWVTVGLVVAFIMRRRGYNLYLWFVLGTVLGPFIVPYAIERSRFHAVERDSDPVPTSYRSGFDVLAGLDGSDESIAALHAALALFGDSVSSLTIATVLDYDSQFSLGGGETGQAQTMLEEAASSTGFDLVQREILFGRADRALVEYAKTHGIELIVVGSRGHGATEALFGSTTSRLIGTSEFPVFVGPSPVAAPASHSAGSPAGAGKNDSPGEMLTQVDHIAGLSNYSASDEMTSFRRSFPSTSYMMASQDPPGMPNHPRPTSLGCGLGHL